MGRWRDFRFCELVLEHADHANCERLPEPRKYLRLQHRLVGIGFASIHPTLAC